MTSHLRTSTTLQQCMHCDSSGTLISARMKQACQHAGVVRDDKLLLVPVDNALQLRPSLAHLDKPAAAAGAPAAGVAEAAEEEDVKPELQAVKVRRHGC